MSHFVQLNIVEPTVEIESNDGGIHAHQGSDVELKCLIKGMLQKPAYVFWYHEDERLLPEYDPSMSDSVKFVGIDPSHSSKDGSKKEQSTSTYFPEHFLDENDLGDQSNQNQGSMYLATLKLNKVRPEQKGTYKCGPSNTSPASVKLHITDGEIRAAMSEGTNTSASSKISMSILSVFICLVSYYL